MSARASTWIGIVVAVAIASLMIISAEFVVAQTACSGGGKPATAEDLAAMKAAGIPDPQVGECWNPNNTNIGQAAGQAKQDLQSMTCNSGVNIQGLDSNFAVCADKFMQALRQASPGACINSGYRSAALQLSICMGMCGASSCPGKCAPPGQSFHQKGLAIDVSYKISNSQAWQIAQSSTNGGIANPSGLHSSDPAHFQATGSDCSGAPVPSSDNTDVYTGTQQNVQQSQPASIANTVQRLFAPPQTVAPYAQPAAITPITAPTTQTNACTPQYICSNGTVYYQSDSCTTSTFQTCQYGCASSGTACATTPTSGTSTTQTTANATVTSSPLGLLQQFLSPVTPTATTTATSAPVSLNSGIYTIVQGELGAQQPQTATTDSSSFEGTSDYVQQTLTGNPNATTYSDTTYSPLMSVFINLQSVLTNLLTYLQPFNGQLPLRAE